MQPETLNLFSGPGPRPYVVRNSYRPGNYYRGLRSVRPKRTAPAWIWHHDVTSDGMAPGADSRIRTDDLIITNDLLYQLSYIGIGHFSFGTVTAGTLRSGNRRFRIGRVTSRLTLALRRPDNSSGGVERQMSRSLQRSRQNGTVDCLSLPYSYHHFTKVRAGSHVCIGLRRRFKGKNLIDHRTDFGLL